MSKVQFQNISKGVATTHGANTGFPQVGKPGEQGYQPAIPPEPIVRQNLTGLTIHGVKPGDIGEMNDGEGFRRLEALGLVKALSREATPARSAAEEKAASLEEKIAILLAENAAMRAAMQAAGVQRLDLATAAASDSKKQPTKSS